jgi:hypothetical protein
MPIPLPPRRTEPGTAARWAARARRSLPGCISLAALVGPLASAHDLGADPLPGVPGWRIGAAVVAATTDASATWPAPRWPGFPGSGQTPGERNGLALEHATVDAAVSWGDRLGAHLAVGQHGTDSPHTEAARLESRWRLGLDTWALQLGRDRVPLGTVMNGAGHFDRLAQPPLIKRFVLDGDWLADGLNLRWQRGATQGLQTADLGLWRVRSYPGGQAGRLAPALHLEGAWGEIGADVFAASLAPRSRGIATASVAGSHTHDQPDCSASLVGVACFDGRTRLLGASASWDPHTLPWRVTIAALAQLDRGELYASGGRADYRGLTQGGWLDVVWQAAPRWSAIARLERSVAQHTLSGPGAGSVSDAAGLSGNQPARRASGAIEYAPANRWRLGLEVGTESGSLPANRWIGLRAAWSAPELLGGSW